MNDFENGANSEEAETVLQDVATCFAVQGELTEFLAHVTENPFDEVARQRLSNYLSSERLSSGTLAARRLRPGA